MKSIKEIAEHSPLSEKQLQKIEQIMIRNNNYAPSTIRQEIAYFGTELGMPDYYFKTTPLKTMANHIEAIKAAGIIAAGKAKGRMEIDLARELKEEAIYLVDDDHYHAHEVEERIETKYPNCRLQSYRTSGEALSGKHLRMYLVYTHGFDTVVKFDSTEGPCDDVDLKKIASANFLKTTTKNTYKRYENLLRKSLCWETPLIEVTHEKSIKELRIMVVINTDSSSRFFSNVSDVFNSYKLYSRRKYIEQFSNGKTVYSFYLEDTHEKDLIRNIVEDISLVYVIYGSPLSSLFQNGKLNAQETVFGVAAWSFSHQFLSSYNEEYVRLSNKLKDFPELLGILRTLKTRLAKDTFDEIRVWDALIDNHEILKKLFKIFDKKFNPYVKNHNIERNLAKAKEDIRQNIITEVDRLVFQAIILFIKVTLRTNFYKEEKTSIAFMYDPRFLNEVDFPEYPFGVFHIIAREMRGFHIRFRDIARGGIRIVRSNNYQNYLNNSEFIFDENYNLAFTQQKKNKDIPEGGSKGTILLRWEFQDKAEIAFKKYINGLLDLIVPDEWILDYYEKEVILFLGPDEGTADLMEWASLRAKVMDYPYWKSFSTGKPVHKGGIPHDLYGMTTNSVHQYVLNILDKVGKKEKNITKVLTGGPDGDLGSNEIMISKDTILAIIDGSGVLYDPEGINRKELKRLAKARLAVENFNSALLSANGFLVRISENTRKLPDGEVVPNGLEFRNTFHLDPRFNADLFVPCGGRPSSVNINNWERFLDEKGNPRFKYIVEGANLFITQEARLRLEEKGVIIFKDASANKGGVTSSSMEVLASLSLSDEEHQKHMCANNGEIPDFRKTYVNEILDLIKANATAEFEIIWKEKQEKNIPISRLSDLVSKKINNITDAIFSSKLYVNKALFNRVSACCCPPVLIKTIGIDKIFQRVPKSYLIAMFSSRLASQYVYKYGLDANEIDFFDFVKNFQ